MNNEIWKPIKGYDGIYEISNFGRVKSLERKVYANFKFGKTRTYKERILKPGIVNGYKQVKLRDNSNKIVYVHRLVAEAFINNPKNYNTVNHKNGNKQDNRVENLEWCTQKENVRKAWETGLCKVDEAKILSGYRLGKSNIGKKKPRKNKIIGGKDENI